LIILKDFKDLNEKNQLKSKRVEFRELFAKITDISPSGKVKIKFSENIIPKEKDAYAKVDQALRVTAMALDLN
jgi:hypothetical protein